MKLICQVLLVVTLFQDPDADAGRRKRIAEALPPLKRITLEAKEGKLKEVLQELQDQTGFRLEFADVADAPITVQIKEATPLEAITLVSKAGGLGYVISATAPVRGAKPPPPGTPPAFWFKDGDYADLPRRFSGHFVVEVPVIHLTRRTRFDAPQRSGRMTVRLTWPPGVSPDTALLDIASVVDDKGGTLYERRPYGSYGHDPAMPGQVRHSAQTEVGMKYPAEDATAITLKGSAQIVFAGEDRFITFEASEKAFGQKKEMADMTAELRGIQEKEGGMTTVTVACKGQPKSPLPEMVRGRGQGQLGLRRFQIRMEDGSTLVSNHTGERHDKEFRVMELNFQHLPSKIKSVEVLAETVYHEERFEFEFKDVPLPK
jgi:hypothetical protein